VGPAGMRVRMYFLRSRRSTTHFSPKTAPPYFPSYYASQGADNAPDGHAVPERMECVSLNLSSLVATPSCYIGCRDLNRYLSLCGFSRCNAPRVLTLDLTSDIPSALVLYDYILTFPAEVDRFWSPLRIRQWGTFIFVVNRYVGIIGHIPIIYSYFFVPSPGLMVGQQDSKCGPVHKYHQFLAVIIQTSVGGTGLTTFHKGD